MGFATHITHCSWWKLKKKTIYSLKDEPSVGGSTFCWVKVGANKIPPACLTGTSHPLECSAHWCLHLRFTIRATGKPLESKKIREDAHQTLEHHCRPCPWDIPAKTPGALQHLASTTLEKFAPVGPNFGSVEFSRWKRGHRETKGHPPNYCIPTALPNVEGHNASERFWKTNKNYVCLIGCQVPIIQTFHGCDHKQMFSKALELISWSFKKS